MPTLRSFLKKFESPKQRILRLSAEGKTDKVRDMVDSEAGMKLVRVRDAKGRTPLFLAAINGHREIVRILTILGADPSARDTSGTTPLAALLALPELTGEQFYILDFLRHQTRGVEGIDPTRIANREIREELAKTYYPRTTVSPTAAEVVGRTKNLPEDVQRIIGKFGGKTRSRKTRRRQTRRKR